MKVLIFVKRREGYCHSAYSYDCSSGLLNSARFIVEMLNNAGIAAKLVEVTDANDIDREVYKYRPDIVIVEALWVVPDKFIELKKLHPNVKWIVRIHSQVPFLAQEGIAIDWIKQYVQIPNVYVAVNSVFCQDDLEGVVPTLLLPNYYPVGQKRKHDKQRSFIDIAAFGAIRPFKNQLMQALAAMKYADDKGKRLFFHVNSSRCEQSGDNVLKNLRALFKGTRHRLIEHKWESHKEFLNTLAKMDVSMCVSFTETFCIVAADSVSVGTPIVTSPQVVWADSKVQADPTNLEDIYEKLSDALSWKAWWYLWNSRENLKMYAQASKEQWIETLNEL